MKKKDNRIRYNWIKLSEKKPEKRGSYICISKLPYKLRSSVAAWDGKFFWTGKKTKKGKIRIRKLRFVESWAQLSTYDPVDLKEFNKLEELCKKAGFETVSEEYFPDHNGRVLRLYYNGHALCDVACHFGSYGHEKGLLEFYDGRNEPTGWLTGSGAFKLFKKELENEKGAKE